MIGITLHPSRIFLGRLEKINLYITNKGSKPCTSIRFRISIPKELVLAGSGRKVEVALLEPGETYQHTLQIFAEEQGEFNISATHFSYRDGTNRLQRVPDYSMALEVIPIPEPDLKLTLDMDALRVSSWESLSGSIKNTGEGVAQEINLLTLGQDLDAREAQINTLQAGETKRFMLPIFVEVIGSRVPVEIITTFSDQSGRSYQKSWPVFLKVIAKSGIRDQEDILTCYQTGLSKVFNRIDLNHPRYDELLVYWQRLEENLDKTRRYGNTDSREASRAEIIDRLNHLTMDVLGVSFIELCRC